MKWYQDPQLLPGIVGNILTADHKRQHNFATILRMYEPSMVPKYMLSHFATPISVQGEGSKLNILNEIIRFATNYFGRSFPKPVFVPYGNKTLRDKADAATNFVNGVFYESKLYPEYTQAVLHALIGGTGIVKVIESDTGVQYECVLPTEVMVFDEESVANNLRSLFHVKHIDKGVLQARYPEYATKIATVTTVDGGYTEQIKIIEGWHLPSAPGADDGKHIIVLEPDIVLVDESYEQDDFPFAFLNYIQSPVGFWGQGLGQILIPYQAKINQLMRNIEANIKAGGNLKIWLQKDSGVSADQITNDLQADVLVGTGPAPQHLVQPLVSPDILNYLNILINSAWAASRFSQSTARGEKPEGIDSRVALLTLQDQVAESHILAGKQVESFVLQLAKLTMDAATRILERTGNVETFYKAANKLEKISLIDCLMEDGTYRIEVQASSRTRDSVSGRLELAEYLASIGVWGKQQVLEALDVPGIYDDVDAELADSRNIDSYLSDIGKGIKRPPHEYLNLPLALQKAVKHYNLLEYQQADPEILQLLAAWIAEVDMLINKTAEQQAEQQGMQQPPELGNVPNNVAQF